MLNGVFFLIYSLKRVLPVLCLTLLPLAWVESRVQLNTVTQSTDFLFCQWCPVVASGDCWQWQRPTSTGLIALCRCQLNRLFIDTVSYQQESNRQCFSRPVVTSCVTMRLKTRNSSNHFLPGQHLCLGIQFTFVLRLHAPYREMPCSRIVIDSL